MQYSIFPPVPASSWPRGHYLGALVALALALTSLCATAAGEPGQNDIRVFINPETGERRLPSQQEQQQTQPATPAMAEMPMIRRDGMRIVRVPENRRMQLQATVDASGQAQTHHGAQVEHE